MKHLFTGLTVLATSLTALAQPDCSQIIQASFTSTVQGNAVVVTNTSTSQFPQATTYQWYFGDGGTSDGNIVTHVYDAPGTYLLCLYAVVENCVDTVCQEVQVGGENPCDNLTAEFAYATTGSVVQFDNALSSNQYSYLWYFGDGTQGYGPDPEHAYPGPGTYSTCLVMWSWNPFTQDTCWADNCETIVIQGDEDPCDGLQAGFFANVQPGAVQFSNATTGTGFQTTWNWSFGDGNTSTDAQPLHEYDQPGGYWVCLTAISIYEQSGGGVITCVDSICQEVTAPGGGSPCDGLNADFNASVQGTMVMIDNAVSSNEYTYIWDFGDGSEGYGPDPAHTYSGPGTYQICLLMWGWNPFTQDTCFADHCEWITIGQTDPCDSLFACFQWGLQNTTAQFYNCSGPNGQDLNYWWSFGDGTNGDGYQPAHTYPGPGTYVVCLTVFMDNSPDSCSNTICNTLVIQSGGSPCDSLTADFVVTTQANIAAFSAFGGSAIGYQWNFGDGTSGDGPAPVHTYPGPGTYHACLITWTWNPFTQDTCYTDHCEWITIGGDPCDGLQAGFQANVGDATVWFSNTTVGTGFQTTWYWNFGDGTTSNDAQPSHIFPGLDAYEVCLTVTSIFEQQGGGVITCQDSTCQLVVTGGSSPCDSLSAEFVVTTEENLAAFTTFGGTAFGYQWNFGDGTEGDGPAPTHTYPGPGAYHACLITWTWDPQTQDTCYADQCQWVIIGGGDPCDTIQSCFTWEGSGTTLLFDNCSSMNGMGPWYLWDFGDGTQSDAISPTHTFPGPGTYTVCLTGWLANSPDSCSSTICHDVVVGGSDSPCDSLSADFEVAGIEIQAVFTSFGGTAIGYHWTFGDGTQGDGANPVHVYPGPGTYQACLVTWTWDPQTQDTCYADHCEWITIGSGTPCDSLEAHFVWEPAGPNAFLFQDASETNGQDVSYWWSFGDGTNADGPNPDHVYQQPGEYTVCLTITALNAPDSCTSTTCQTIIVQGGGSPCDGLNAEFTPSVSGYTVAVQAAFNPPGTSFEWLFGDGTSGDGPSATHTYPGPGTYNLCLVVGNYDPVTQDSCFEDHCLLITLQGGGSVCDSLWTASFEYGNQGNVYTFYNTSNTQGAEVSTHWDFGDGTFGDGSQLIHTYTVSGLYTVCMTITGFIPGTGDTCQVEVCQNIEISVGMDDLAGSVSLDAWPQPFDGLLHVAGAGLQGNTRVTLLDMTGRLVDDRAVFSAGRLTLDYGNLPTGTYLLHVRTDLMDRTLRVVKY